MNQKCYQMRVHRARRRTETGILPQGSDLQHSNRALTRTWPDIKIVPNQDFMKPISELKALVKSRDMKGILRMMFRPGMPELQQGFYREDQWWDFKEECPSPKKANEVEWAKLATDVLAFYNQEGGIIFFGIKDSDYRFVGAKQRLDTKQFNDKIRKYSGDRFWVSFSREFIQADQRYLGVAVVPPRPHSHQRILRDGPTVEGKPLFKAGDLCVRLGDETRILRESEAIRFAATRGLGTSAATFAVDEANYRILRPALYKA